MKIAITGGIGSGKSFVCSLLARRGIAVYDCDSAAKRIMRSSDDVRTALTQLIGPETYNAEGLLNKAAVAAYLLASPENARAIDDIVHPAVATDFRNSGINWMECAILYESGFDRLVDCVVAVTAPEAVRLQRVMRRDGITKEKAMEWMSRQWPQEEVKRRANYEIVNDGILDIDSQIYDLIIRLKLSN